MMKYLIGFFLILTSPILLLSQNNVSKEEIHKVALELEKKNIERVMNRKDTSILTYVLNKTINSFLDSLQEQKIDTFGVYSNTQTSWGLNDKCNCGIMIWSGYVHWKKNGNLYHKMLTECCKSKRKEIDYSVILGYYQTCTSELQNEYILDVITGVSTDKKGKIVSIESISATDWASYTIYCKVGDSKFIRWFGEYQIFMNEGMFQNENQNSRLFSWVKLIENQMNEIEKK